MIFWYILAHTLKLDLTLPAHPHSMYMTTLLSSFPCPCMAFHATAVGVRVRLFSHSVLHNLMNDCPGECSAKKENLW